MSDSKIRSAARVTDRSNTTPCWPDRNRLDPFQLDWLPVGKATSGDVLQIVKYASPPAIGQHVGKVYTSPDGRWLVLKFAQSSKLAESYFILPEPPL